MNMMKKYLITLLLIISCFGLQAQTDNGLIYIEYKPIWQMLPVPDNLYYDIDLDGVNDFKVVPQCDMFGRLAGQIRLTSSSRSLVSRLTESVILTDTTLDWYFQAGPNVVMENPHTYDLGYRIEVEEGMCYGWVKMYVLHAPNWDTVYVKMEKSCFCSIPNYPLRYGQTSLTQDLEENESTAVASIYPNPATATVTIVGEGLRQIEITDMLGQRVATHQAEGPQAIIDISTLPTGIYFVGITDENGKRCVKKVIKE